MYIPRSEKLLFHIDDGWGKLLTKYSDAIPEWTQLVVERMLACGTPAMGGAGTAAHLPIAHTPNTFATAVSVRVMRWSDGIFECGSRFTSRGITSSTPSAVRKEAMVISGVEKICLNFGLTPEVSIFQSVVNHWSNFIVFYEREWFFARITLAL